MNNIHSSFLSSLPKIEETSTDQSLIKVGIYNNKGDLQEIFASYTDPSKNSWFFQRWFRQLTGRISVPVRLEGEEKPLFMKVEQLSEVLSINRKELAKMNKGEMTEFLIKNNESQVIEKIAVLASNHLIMEPNKDAKQILKQLTHRIDYRNLLKCTKGKEFDELKMVRTILEIGQRLETNQTSFNLDETDAYYSATVADNTITIIHREETETNIKEKRLNLNKMKFGVLDVAKKRSSSTEKFVKKALNVLLPSTMPPKKVEELAVKSLNPSKNDLEAIKKELEHFKIKDSKANTALDNLCAAINPENLTILLKQTTTEEERLTLLQTFIAIGSHFPRSKPFGSKSFKDIYQKKKVGKTHAFAINSNNEVFINLRFLARGASKKVSEAIKLNNLQPLIRAKIRGSSEDIKGVKAEKKLLDYLHTRKIPYIIKPYVSQIDKSRFLGLGKSKLVLFQERYQASGKDLNKASLENQLTVLSQMATALASLHENGYIHGDFKPENFLIEGDLNKNPQGRLADFGGAIKKGENLNSATKSFLPREALIIPKNASAKIEVDFILATPDLDSFALGVSVLDNLTKTSTINNKLIGCCSQTEIHTYINKKEEIVKNSTFYSSKEKKILVGLLEISKKLLDTNPEKRLSCREAAQHMHQLNH